MREMKDSGVEWIGDIPKEWNVVPIKAIANCYGRIGFRGYTAEDLVDEGEGAITLSPTNIINSHINLDKCSYLSWDKYYESPEIMVYRNDIVFVKTASVGKCAIYDSDEIATVNPQFVVFKELKCDYRFLYYNLISDIIQKQLNLNNMGGVIGTITQKALLGYKIAYSKFEVQERISDYLDTKCAKIDSIIEKQQAIIEKLKEYKLSVITEAVTKGLNPDVEMKDSGVKWIGRVPRNWIIGKAKYFVKITNGSDPVEKGNIPVYGSGSKSFKTCGEYKEGPCVLIGRKGATLHIPHYIEGRYWNVDTAFDVKAINSIDLKYYYYLACCFDYKQYISQTTLPGMTQTNYGNMFLPIPKLDEQKKIVNYVDNKLNELENQIIHKEKMVEKLQEYKKSLIYEVVTGKKEV